MKKLLFYLIAWSLTQTISAHPGCLQSSSSTNHFVRCNCTCSRRVISNHNTCLDCGHCHTASKQAIVINAYEEFKQFNQKQTQPYTQCWNEIKKFEAHATAQKPHN